MPPPPETPQPAEEQHDPERSDQQLTSQSPTAITPAPNNDTEMTYETPADPSDPYNSMPPPPSPSTYPTLQELMTACQTHARSHGYACVTSSNNYKRGIAYVRCDRGGHYANHWHLTPETRQRHNRTRRLVGCAWKARAKRLKTGEWELRMMVDHHSGHGPSGDAKAHPSLRKLGTAAVETAKTMFAEGRPPKEVLERLKSWNEAVTPQDVYNLKAKIARENGETPGPASGADTSTQADGTPSASAAKAKPRGRKPRGAGANGGNAAIANADANSSTMNSNAATAALSLNGAESSAAMQDNPEPLLDPALQMQSMGPSIGGRAPPAPMQNTSSLPANSGQASEAVNGNGELGKQKGKCQCTCCDH